MSRLAISSQNTACACLRIVIIDGPDSWAKALVDEGKVEKFYPVDFTDEAVIFDKCLQRIREAEKACAPTCWSNVRSCAVIRHMPDVMLTRT